MGHGDARWDSAEPLQNRVLSANFISSQMSVLSRVLRKFGGVVLQEKQGRFVSIAPAPRIPISRAAIDPSAA
jgi:hypothetical protein